MSDMKQQKNKSEDTVCALLYDGDAQTETGCEYTLPDYLPDIRKILRVQAEPRVTGRYLSGEKAELEGTVSASVVYMAEDGTLHVCPIENTFGQNIPITGLDENTTAIFHTRVDNNTCRLTGPRKLNLRHKLKTQVHVFTKCSSHPDLSEIPAAERDRVCLDLKERETCRMLCTEPEEVRYSEDLPAESGTVREILTCEISALPGEARISDGRLRLSGDFRISLLCTVETDDGILCRPIVKRVPFSETFDAPGIPDHGRCEPDITITAMEAVPGDGGKVCAVDFTAEFSALCACDTMAAIASDAFLPGYVLEEKREDIQALRPGRFADSRITVNGTIKYDPSDDITSVCDCRVSVTAEQFPVRDGQVQVSGSMEITAIAETADHRFLPVTGTVPVHWEADSGFSGGGDFLICGSANMVSVTPHLDKASHTISCDAELLSMLSVYKKERMSVITALTAVPDGKKDGESPAILLCYPEVGETFWEIAKHYKVSPALLKKKNNISEDRVCAGDDDVVLFIPTGKS